MALISRASNAVSHTITPSPERIVEMTTLYARRRDAHERSPMGAAAAAASEPMTLRWRPRRRGLLCSR